jgi:tetratricopeptide (TPR) repeat protein
MRKAESAIAIIMCLVVVALAASSLLQDRTQNETESPNLTTTEAVAKAQALNTESRYAESLNLLLKKMESDPENKDLKANLQETFTLYVNSELQSGYARIEKNKHDEGGYVSIANAYKLSRQYTEAMKALVEGTLENPKSVLLWLNIGLLELLRGKDAEALAVYKEVLRIDKKSAIALNNVAYVESRSEDPRLIDLKEARLCATLALASEPGNANFLETLALIEFKEGKREEATRLIKQAIAIDPNESLYRSELETFENGKNKP